MKLSLLPKATDLAKLLYDAKVRLGVVNAWPTEGVPPLSVSIDRCNVMLFHEDAQEKLVNIIVALIEREIVDLERELRELGVYEL